MSDESVAWLRAKYARHGEIEDKEAADEIIRLSAEVERLTARLAEADALIAKGLAVVHDFLPNIGRCVLQDYQRMNEFCSEAAARAAVSASEDIVREQRLAEAEALRETRAKELHYVVEACTAALVIRTTHESRDALRDLRAWATNRIDAHLAREEKP